MAQALGTDHYFGGSHDTGTGHIHPMKYVIGLAKAASVSGAELFEESPASGVTRNGRLQVKTDRGTITADRVLLALNGYHNDFRSELASHVLPIQSFIGATIPLGKNSSVLPGRRPLMTAGSLFDISENPKTAGCCLVDAKPMESLVLAT